MNLLYSLRLLRVIKYFCYIFFFFFSSRRRHTRYWRDWSSDVCSSDLLPLRSDHRLLPQRRHPPLSSRGVGGLSAEPLPALRRRDPLVRQRPGVELRRPSRALPRVPGADLLALPAGRAGQRALLPRDLSAYRRADHLRVRGGERLHAHRADLHRRRDPDPPRRHRHPGHGHRIGHRRARAGGDGAGAHPGRLVARLGPRRALGRGDSPGHHRPLLAGAARGRDGTGRRQDAGHDRRAARLARGAGGAARGLDERRVDRRAGGAAQPRGDAPGAAVRRLPRLGRAHRPLLRPYTLRMVPGPDSPLTQTGFRRDVRLFLTCLPGFLIAINFALLLFLRTNMVRTEAAVRRTREMMADTAADAVNHGAASSLDTLLGFLRGRYDVAALQLDRRGGRSIVAGQREGELEEVTRLTGAGTLHVRFDAAAGRMARRSFLITAV